MAIDFRVDDDHSSGASGGGRAGFDAADLGESIGVGIRAIAVVVVAGGLAVAGAIAAMQKAILAADHLIRRGQPDYWQELWMPAVLFGFLGGIYGAMAGWRMVSAAGLNGMPAWIIGGIGSAVLAVIAVLVALAVFGGAIPLMGWICVAFLFVAGIVGTVLSTHWLG